MHWESKNFVSHFITIFALLQWSGTEVAICSRYTLLTTKFSSILNESYETYHKLILSYDWYLTLYFKYQLVTKIMKGDKGYTDREGNQTICFQRTLVSKPLLKLTS